MWSFTLKLKRLLMRFFLPLVVYHWPDYFRTYPRPRLLRIHRWVWLHFWLIFSICIAIFILYVLFRFFFVVDRNLAILFPISWSDWSELIHKINQANSNKSSDLSPLAAIILLAFMIAMIIPVLLILVDTLISEAKKDLRREHAILAQREEAQQQVPGLKLSHTLRGHTGKINQVTWSHDSAIIATGADDWTVRLWDARTGQLLHTFINEDAKIIESVAWSPDGSTLAISVRDYIQFWDTRTYELLDTLDNLYRTVYCMAWSPDGTILASGASDGKIWLWDTQMSELLHALDKHSAAIYGLAWSPDGRVLASCSKDKTVRLWDAKTGQLLHTLTEHSAAVYSVVWSPDGRTLVSCSEDETVRLWDTRTGRQTDIIDGYSGPVSGITFSSDTYLLASQSKGGTVWLQRSKTWDKLATLKPTLTIRPPRTTTRRGRVFVTQTNWSFALAFHPKLPILATLGEDDTVVRIWELDIDTLLSNAPADPSVSYTNAKVVLVGDSGVGKSGLGLVLSGQRFTATESTHGRHVWTFDHQEVDLDGKCKETREIFLWDMAGQPGYRLIHQLHLNEVVVALVVIDARSESDPFAGVQHWDRALRQAQRVQGSSALPLKKFLVTARADRGGIGASPERIQSLKEELGFDGYFETSAKEDWHITDLQDAIRDAIDWEALPRVSSTKLFQRIKTFLIAEKGTGQLISSVDDLYRAFLKSADAPAETEDLRTQFETCIGRVESQGLIKRLSFGKLVLLQPESLDAYASALVNVVKDEPDGLGSIAEERVRAGRFRMPEGERIEEAEQEKFLLIAMVEDLVRRELVLREEQFLVFPSQSTRENPDLPDPDGQTVVFEFEGPVLHIYATLAVRLSYSGLFKKKALWKNAITYTANAGGTCGLFLRNIDEGRGELTLFFDNAASEETQLNFEEYVKIHLQRRSLEESLKRRRIFTCTCCNTTMTNQIVQARRARGFNWLGCPVCSEHILLLDREERLETAPTSRVLEMDRAADSQRDREAAKSTIQGKQATNDFDVFLCHHGVDKAAVKKVGEQLKEHGLLPWLDEWELRPGLPWQRLLEEQIGHIKSAAVFIGKSGVGPWQDMELKAFLRQFVNRQCPVIPVILPDCEQDPEVPLFLEDMTWVDFRRQDPDPLERLIWGITGQRL